ncbi:class I SAM-dependent RNA methyltransferase [Corynebacterium lipophiloflavum]|uniref:TRAM domain protein n=1 Tax=Corynebacterium lipophiloflavum (strain ATCC 700352 / DSM 44291 / CCUG 37336 / JCM 10383 / DMMZ 1944) TaxID=525263 RepID=C0XSM6_CORLD|nr:TRAM domain-containing protein [Corynebacterium lipophiloflavum]EEI16764.1 TRAM domain protein [Corynebacterium lipophiloflavum DSM 44291]
MRVSAIADNTTLELDVTAMAHGGEGIARDSDGRVVFVGGAIPGDKVRAELTKVKKMWARAQLTEVVSASPDRVSPTCPVAARGGGCCDYSHIAPAAQPGIKREVLIGQLGAFSNSAEALGDTVVLEPATRWRSRVRLGVDSSGRAGVRTARSTQLITDVACSQVVPGLLDGIVGPGARTFTPGAEVIAVLDSTGQRHVVESTRAQRGRRVEKVDRVVEGSGVVEQNVGKHAFRFPATAFWQAHVAAPAAYSEVIRSWGKADYERATGWDLYGGVGAFVPAIDEALGGAAHIDSVDYSVSATRAAQDTLAGFALRVHNSPVEKAGELTPPGLVVLDPPRSGAGEDVVRRVAGAAPERIIHVGCDPATFARDLGYWAAHGFGVRRMVLIDAFPNTHHFEMIAQLEPDGQMQR